MLIYFLIYSLKSLEFLRTSIYAFVDITFKRKKVSKKKKKYIKENRTETRRETEDINKQYNHYKVFHL